MVIPIGAEGYNQVLEQGERIDTLIADLIVKVVSGANPSLSLPLAVDKLEDGSIKRETITSVIYVPLTSAKLQYGKLKRH